VRVALGRVSLGAQAKAGWLNTRTGETRADAPPAGADALYTPPWPDSLLFIERDPPARP
jgi:hypothetical protein